MTSGRMFRALEFGRVPQKRMRAIVRRVFAGVLALVCVSLLTWELTSGEESPRDRTINPRLTVDDLREIPRNLYYMQKENVMYCYIPKNACSRLKPLLRKREGFEDWNDPTMVHGRKNGLLRLRWLAREEAFRYLRSPSFYRFVVLRDPFSRLISAYENKVASPWPDQREDFWNVHLQKECPSMIESMQMPQDGPLMSLVDFLKCLHAKDAKEPSNEHWRPQSELCGLDYIKYNKYIFLENLHNGVTDLLHDLNWNEDTNKFLIDRVPVYSKPLDSFFSQEAIDLALQYYKKDFELLGYSHVPQGTIGFYSIFNGTNFVPGFVPPVDYQPPVMEQGS